MRYLALACDYDGTIAHDGRVSGETLDALRRVRSSKRRLILVTGRELPDLQRVFPELGLFDLVVAENGALLFDPAARETAVLSEPPPPRFAEELGRRGVEPVSTGEVIVATWRPHENTVLDVIREQGLELQVIFNKGAVMVLPSGINKAFGLRAALQRLHLSEHNVVGVGDAENDHAFLATCECSVAVANALPSLVETVCFVTSKKRGEGVEELIGELLESDLRDREATLRRPLLPIGRSVDGAGISLLPLADHLLIAGQSGSGKSTLVISILERLAERRYQFCLVDPEGDYDGVEAAVFVGDPDHSPNVDEVLALLEQPDDNVVVNLLNVDLEARPAYLEDLLEKLRAFHGRTGRPHRLILDEAHHMLPHDAADPAATLGGHCQAAVLVTVHPEHLARAVMSSIDHVVIVGKQRERFLSAFAEVLGAEAPAPPANPERRDSWYWNRRERHVVAFRPNLPRAYHKRHQRKYAEGDLGDARSFVFTGPRGELSLKAVNLMMFLQMADGVGDPTWEYHRKRGDYSKWLRTSIKDDGLADAVERIESADGASPSQTRADVREEIERRYTAPA